MDLSTAYTFYRPLLHAIAYRLLGSAVEAEDIVQETFVSLSLQSAEWSAIRDMKSYLCRSVTNRCYNVLKSARRRRETYTGPWLPEPVIAAGADGPEAAAERNEALSYAFLIMAERLSPAERIVYVLREAFEMTYEEIAMIADKTVPNCRQLYRRAWNKLHKDRPEAPMLAFARNDQRDIAQRFAAAFERGDMEELVQLLNDGVVFVSDGGGKVRAAVGPVAGRNRVLALLRGMRNKSMREFRLIRLHDGDWALERYDDENTVAIWYFAYDQERNSIGGIYAVYNPDKLGSAVSFRVDSLFSKTPSNIVTK